MTTSRRASSLEEKRHLGKGEKENSRRRRKRLGKEEEMVGGEAAFPPRMLSAGAIVWGLP